MASVLIMSKQGDGVPIALRLQQEGHIVKIYIQDKEAKASLEGFKNPSQVPSPKMLEQYDLILYDMAGMGEQADQMREKGNLVLGGGSFNDKLELDRDYGQRVANTLTQLKTPGGEKVTSIEEANKVLNSGSAKSIKPLGNAETRYTLVSEDPKNRSLISMLKNLKGELLPAIIQDTVSGVEISTEGWFDGKEFKYFNHTIEHKRLMEGDVGPMTGCMGNVVWACNEDKLVEYGLLPLVPLLKKVDYLGPIDINCIVTEHEAYFLEFTPRFGYDAIQAWSELLRGSLFDFLWRLGMQDRGPKVREDYAIAVRLSMPPYPSNGDEIKQLKGVKLLDIPKEAEHHIFLADVMMNGWGAVCAGVDGVLGCVTARGQEIYELRRRAYRTINNICIHGDIQFRKDIGAGVEKSIDKLKTWGWLDAN